MSRIGKAPIPVPSGVEVSISGRRVAVKGPKGALDLEVPGEITVRQDGEEILVERPDDERVNRAMHGLTRSLVNNMMVGVSEGFRKELQIVGVGYRCIAKGTDALELQLGFSHPVLVERPDDERVNRAMHGLTRSLVNNMMVGVSEGFRKELQIVGVGYRCIAKGTDALELQLGFSHPVLVEAPDGISFEVPEPTRIIVSGPDKQVVGQVAADIRSHRKPEPYKGKGVRYLGEHVARKAGKAAK